MKRIFAVLLTVTILLSMVGCVSSGIVPAAEDPAAQSGQLAAQPTEALPTDAPATQAPETEPVGNEPQPAQSEAPADPAVPEIDRYSAYDLFSNRIAEEGDYTLDFDGYEQSGSYSYYVPELDVNTQGARSINRKIEQRFVEEVERELDNIEQEIGSMLLSVDWYLDVWNGVISIVVYENLDWGETEYAVYYYDTRTGAELDASQMLARLDLRETAFIEAVRDAVRERFIDQYAELAEENREDYGYNAMLKTVDDNQLINLETVKFYVSDGPMITVAAPVPSLAGASYYYQVLYPDFPMG